MADKKLLVLDDNESVFFREQTRHIQAKVYATKHKQFKALDILPVDDSAPSGSTTIEYRYYDTVGVAAIISDYGKGGIPRVDAYGISKSVTVKPIADAYGVTIPEIRRASNANVPLSAMKGTMAKKGIDIKHDQVAWLGDAEYGLQGLLNYPGILEYTVLGDGTAGSKAWTAKTAAQILRDVSAFLSSVRQATNGVEQCDTVLMPIAQFDYIKGTTFGPEGTKTILTVLRETFPEITLWDSIAELKGAGASVSDRMIAFSRDKEHLAYQMPTMPEQQEPEKDGLEYVTVFYSESGGMTVYYPLSVVFADGI